MTEQETIAPEGEADFHPEVIDRVHDDPKVGRFLVTLWTEIETRLGEQCDIRVAPHGDEGIEVSIVSGPNVLPSIRVAQEMSGEPLKALAWTAGMTIPVVVTVAPQYNLADN